MSFDLAGGLLLVPRAQELPERRIDLAAIKRIEARIDEVALVTPHKAPELLAAFNKAYADLHEHVTVLEVERLRAEREANKRKAVVLLDNVVRILKEKNLWSAKSPTGSEDMRNAILDQDVQYEELTDKVGQLEAIIELLKGKMKSFEMAYTSVKKILGENAFNMLNRINPNTGNTGTGDVGSEERTNGFGKARY